MALLLMMMIMIMMMTMWMVLESLLQRRCRCMRRYLDTNDDA